MSERILPHNLNAERAVLGAILVDAELLATVLPELRADEFFRGAHQRIYRAMGELAKSAGGAIDLLTLADALGDALDDCGGIAYLTALTDGVPRSSNILRYAAIVRRAAQLRACIGTANEVLHRAYEGEDPDAIVDRAGQQFLEIAEHREHSKLLPIGSALAGTMASIEARANSATHLSGLSTGLADLDDMLGGLLPGKLIIVAARPSVGKSSLLLSMASAVSAAGKRVALFSLEMEREELCLRMLAATAQVSGRHLLRGTLTDVDYRRVADALGEVEAQRIYIDDTVRLLTHELMAKVRAMQFRASLDLVMVDYIQLMPGDPDAENRTQALAGISSALKGLARELKIPVVAASQLSRASEGRRDKRPQLSDLRESGALEQDADVVIAVHREHLYSPKIENADVAELIVLKQRNGPTGSVVVRWIAEQTRFADRQRSLLDS